jgi:diacylglycerol O-acyltransferase
MAFPMSPTDALFLLAETPKRPMHVGALALLSRPDGAGPNFVRDAFAAALDRDQVAPLWRRRTRRSLSSLGQWYWHTDTDVDLDYHVQISALPRRAGRNALWNMVSDLHSERLDRSRPLWQMHLIEGLVDGQYALYIKTHHALADGVSTMRLLRRTVSSDPDRRGMPALWEATVAAPSDDAITATTGVSPLAAARRMLGVAGDLAGFAPALADTAWRAARRRGGPLTLTAPHTQFNVAIDAARCFAGRSFPIDRLQLVAKHTDATLNDVVLAMCGGALRRYLLARHALPSAPLMATVPVSLRAGEPVGAPDAVPHTWTATPAKRDDFQRPRPQGPALLEWRPLRCALPAVGRRRRPGAEYHLHEHQQPNLLRLDRLPSCRSPDRHARRCPRSRTRSARRIPSDPTDTWSPPQSATTPQVTTAALTKPE